jgi:RimJ/RimL family protein N-acetyltransferase
MSVNPERVERETHEAWYRGLLASRDRHLYLGLLDGVERVGVCRFDMESGNGRAEVSINLNPACRGRRLSAALLSAAMTRFRNEQGANLSARIKPSNIASIRCFTANGFVLVGGDTELAHYRYDCHPPHA